ncbi:MULTISPECIES: NAD-dependent epimerase/dehydratase family protein [Prochlorococcus]|uniref:NAD-dependent epimerase/dehydratase family protein n=1 Tax=Prochlorococcus TaxID=1218 RepID=UPI000533B19F|nr:MULTISPECIES: NAD(P)-dependent oxidoreductase [Prochlorococcus]KGG12278.1 Nucleoside-diphosphate-sugar epimerase [Prochlorococcus sp. MIT 0601]
MKETKILITGATGCVGQYTSNWLLKNTQADLYLLLRDPRKLTSVDQNEDRVNLLISDLREIEVFREELSEITHVIHTATAWGDPVRANEVNLIAVKKMLSLLNPLKIERIIYFSTASILNNSLKPLPEALAYGTEYIQTKAKCLEELENHKLSKKTIAIFPTLVFGGRCDGKGIYPRSYLTEGINEAASWLWLARWFKAYSRFHFIHAADIAFICGQLCTKNKLPTLESSSKEIPKLVLGQPAISIDQAIETLLHWRGLRKTPSLPLWGWLIRALIIILPIKISSWDRFSIKQRHFVHKPVTNPESFGGKSFAKTLKEILFKSGLPRKTKIL